MANTALGRGRNERGLTTGDTAQGGIPLQGTERAAALVGGGLLVHWGLRHGGLLGLAGTLAGGAIAWMGVNGTRPSGYSASPGALETGTRRDARAEVLRSVVIDRPAAELYRFWRNFSNLPQALAHVESIEVVDDRRSRWTVKAPAGQTVGWEAVVTDDQTDRRIAWQSAPGADVENRGWIEFQPMGDSRTRVTAMIDYKPPAGEIGRMVAKLFGEEPGLQLADDLQRFKRLMEKPVGAAGTRKAM